MARGGRPRTKVRRFTSRPPQSRPPRPVTTGKPLIPKTRSSSRPKPRPILITRITRRKKVKVKSRVAGKTVRVSTKSVFPFEAVAQIRKRTQAKLRGRQRVPKPTGLRSRPRPTRQVKVKITKRRFGTDFDIFRTFSKTTTTGRRSTGRPPRPTKQPKPPRRRFRRTRSGSDFDVLNF